MGVDQGLWPGSKKGLRRCRLEAAWFDYSVEAGRNGQAGKKELAKQINAYLNFSGDCEAAFKLYERVLGGKIEAMMP